MKYLVVFCSLAFCFNTFAVKPMNNELGKTKNPTEKDGKKGICHALFTGGEVKVDSTYENIPYSAVQVDNYICKCNEKTFEFTKRSLCKETNDSPIKPTKGSKRDELKKLLVALFSDACGYLCTTTLYTEKTTYMCAITDIEDFVVCNKKI